MKHYLKLVPISTKIHRKQSRMTRICITLAVILVAVMFGLADMYLQGVTQHEIEKSGNWHYAFHAINSQTASFISARPEVKISGWHNTVSSEAGYFIKEQPITISAQDKGVFEDIFLNGIAEGKYPDAPNEIAISSSLKDTASVLLNDTVELYNLNGSVADYQIVGFLDDTKTSHLIAENLPIVVMTPEGLGTLAVSNANESYVAQFSHLCNIPDAINDIKAANHLTDEQITGNTPLLSIQGQIEGKSGVNQIYQVAFILSSEDVNAIKNIFTNGGVIFSDSLSQVQQQRNLYYTFAVLVYGFLSIIVAITIFHIMNTINLGVAAKMKEYGSMRAIGMSNRQLIKMIIAEAGTYAISGVIWGCIIGLPMHWVIYVSLITNIWGTAWSVPFIPLILIIAIVLLTSLLAVKGPAKRLQRMSIVENISAQ